MDDNTVVEAGQNRQMFRIQPHTTEASYILIGCLTVKFQHDIKQQIMLMVFVSPFTG